MKASVWCICFTNVNDELMLVLRVAHHYNVLTGNFALTTWLTTKTVNHGTFT